MLELRRRTVGGRMLVAPVLRPRETFGSNTQNAVQIGMEAAHNAREAAADRHFQSRSRGGSHKRYQGEADESAEC